MIRVRGRARHLLSPPKELLLKRNIEFGDLSLDPAICGVSGCGERSHDEKQVVLGGWLQRGRQDRGWRRKALLYSLLAVAGVMYPDDGRADQASRAADFLNILGINGHIGSNVTPYLNAAGVVTDSQYLGIKHWRDSLAAQASWQITPLQALVNAGITLVGLPLQNQTITISDHITRATAWAALGPNALYALEGPNEPNNFPITYNGASTGAPGNPTTLSPVANFQRDYYTAIKANSVLKAIPLWSVTLGGSEPDNVGLQYLTIPTPIPTGVLMPNATVYADAANIHSYPMYDHGAQTVDQTADRINITYDHNFVQTYARNYSGYTVTQADLLPKVMTEFGYAATGGAPGGTTVDVPTQGKNILTGLFNAWVKGYQNVDIYDLYDLGDGYGLFSNTGISKISGTYLHNLTSILADTGANAWSFIPGASSYALAGLPATGHSLLFQKSSGSFELVVWNDIANWNVSTGTAIAIAPTNVSISLPAAAANINTYDPTTGILPTQSSANAATVTIPLRDYPLVVEIGPPGVSPPPPPPPPALTASLAANPSVIHKSQSTMLSWQSTNATSCSGGGFSTGGAIRGSQTAKPHTTTVYSISCSGAGGSASAATSVTIIH
jgi:hypothetical protein